MHTDKNIQANSSLLSALFPVQTKSMTSIVIWGIIFLMDVIGVVAGAFYLGWMDAFSKVLLVCLLAVSLALFWLQGIIWAAIARRLKISK